LNRLTPLVIACLPLLALAPHRASAQLQGTVQNANPVRRGVADTYGFTWGMNPVRTPEGGMAYGYPFVTMVVKGSGADRAGLAVGDTIISISGRDARHGPLFPNRLPRAQYTLRVRRGGEEVELNYVISPPAP